MNNKNKARLKSLLLGSVLLLIAVYGAVLLWVYLRQESLLFHPEPLGADHVFALGADVHEERIEVPGATLSALHLRLPAPKGVVFFLHGNAGNLASWFVNADFYRRANYDLFMIDYRGYGKSSGQIASEAELRADVRAAWDQVAPRYQGLRRVIYGRSLGSGLAAGLAAQVAPELTILVSPYSSMQAMAKEHFPFVPAGLLRYPLRTADDAARLRRPLLLVHGERDTLVAPHHSTEIMAVAPQAKLLSIPGAGHGDLQDFEPYRRALREALTAL
jgi:alpha-beta hydrolase superfamily lysophospholipase